MVPTHRERVQLEDAQEDHDRFDHERDEEPPENDAAIQGSGGAIQNQRRYETHQQGGHHHRTATEIGGRRSRRRPRRAAPAEVHIRSGAKQQARPFDYHEAQRSPPGGRRHREAFARQAGRVDGARMWHQDEPPCFGHPQTNSGGSIKTVPTTMPHGVKMAMMSPMPVATAAGSVQIVGPGSSMRRLAVASSAVVNRTSRRAGSRPVTTGRSAAGSQFGSRLSTTGRSAKFPGGGGDVVAHSSVSAPHGLSPAARPVNRLTIRFATVRRTPSARMRSE